MLNDWDWPSSNYLDSYNKDLNEVGWKRSWAMIENERVVGSLDLLSGVIETNLHRCTLMMGVEEDCKGKVIGSNLLVLAIEWAKKNNLVRIDLGVFSTNLPAQSLYKKYKFTETGVVEDRFRVDGVKVGDIQMSFKL